MDYTLELRLGSGIVGMSAVQARATQRAAESQRHDLGAAFSAISISLDTVVLVLVLT